MSPASPSTTATRCCCSRPTARPRTTPRHPPHRQPTRRELRDPPQRLRRRRRRITIPRVAGGRIWFSIGSPLTFLLNPGPALVEPSVSNASDPNINILWDFCEFTYNAAQLYVNISAVDFFSIPVALTLTGSAGTQKVAGPPSAALDTVRPRSKRRAPPTAKAGTN